MDRVSFKEGQALGPEGQGSPECALGQGLTSGQDAHWGRVYREYGACNSRGPTRTTLGRPECDHGPIWGKRLKARLLWAACLHAKHLPGHLPDRLAH